jgi:hypothetical protein
MNTDRTDQNKSVKIRVNRWLRIFSKGVNKLQFQIKGQEYFLAFVEQEKRWYVFAPTAQGVHRIPVYVDAAKYEKPGVLGTETTLSS